MSNARAPSVHPRNAPPGSTARRIEVVWHAEGDRGVERCFIDVFRRTDGTPMVTISAPQDAVLVSYEGPIDGVEDVIEDDVAVVASVHRPKA